MTDPRYPIGQFSPDPSPSPQTRSRRIEQIAALPASLRQAVRGLTEAQFNTPYREGGWTVRQVVHHLADSHMNAYVRFKLAVTEDTPPIKSYDESAWAKLNDSTLTPVDVSLTLVESLHARWTILLQSFKTEDFHRKFVHSELGPHDVDWLLCVYSWHGNHHVAHITGLKERMKW